MAKKTKQLTQEQIDFRNNILRGKVKEVKRAKKVEFILTEDDKIKQCLWYLNNCVYWVNEYIDGREDKKQLLKVAIALQSNGKTLEALLK